MKKVIDAGMLRSGEFISFLKYSSSNIAIITDCLALETFQGTGRPNFGNLHRGAVEYPKQIIILKSTIEISRLYPKKEGLHARFIDRKQTKELAVESVKIVTNLFDQEDFKYNFIRNRIHSNHYIALLRDFTSKIREGISRWISTVDSEDMKKLRATRKVSQALGQKVLNDIMSITAVGFDRGDFPKNLLYA